MKIAILSPSFPPKNCGVGDFTARLSAELARSGHQPVVWTSQKNTRKSTAVEMRGVENFGPIGFAELGREVVEARPDAVLVQFTPNLFGERTYGVNPLLAPWIAGVRLELKRPVLLHAHELHYPMGLSPDRLVIGTAQFGQILTLAQVSSGVICSYEAAVAKLKRFLPWQGSRFGWVPSGATVLPDAAGSLPTGVPEDVNVLLHFGSSHPSRLLDYALEGLAVREKKAPSKTLLAFVGIAQDELDGLLKTLGYAKYSPQIRALGYLPDSEVSAWMRRADAVLAPFIDGISTRRTSVLSALAHGKPVLSTEGWASSSSIPWKEFTLLTPVGDREGFARALGRLLEDPLQKKRLGENAAREFDSRFSWSSIASGVIARIAG